MSFSTPSFPSPAASAPTPPPNPPMFGSGASKSSTGGTPQATTTWIGSVLGAGANPSQTAQKTLLGS